MPPGQRLPGGAPMNVAARLASFGMDVHLLSRVGNEDLGRELLAYMASQGLNTVYIQIDERYPTGTVLVDLSDPEAVQYEIVEPVAWDFIDADQYLNDAGGGSDTIVFGSLAARNEVSRTALLQLLEVATLRVFDVNLRPPFADRDIVESLLRHSDWVKVNDTELDVMAQWDGTVRSREAAMRGLQQKYGIESVCVTLGADGAMLLAQDELFCQHAFDVPTVDTIGCGDAFLGAWLCGMLTGTAPQEALRRAAAVGALVTSSKGANPPLREADIRSIMGAGAAR